MLNKTVYIFSKCTDDFSFEMSSPLNSACSHSDHFSYASHLGQELECCIWDAELLHHPLLPSLPSNKWTTFFSVSNHPLLHCESNAWLYRNLLLPGKLPRKPYLTLNWNYEVIFCSYNIFFHSGLWNMYLLCHLSAKPFITLIPLVYT